MTMGCYRKILAEVVIYLKNVQPCFDLYQVQYLRWDLERNN